MAPGRYDGLQVGLLEPHLRRYGGIRRMVEFANRLVARGHRVRFYVPRTERRGCTWMRCDAEVRFIEDGHDDHLDILVFNDEPQWYLLERFRNARRTAFYALHYSKLYAKRGSWEALRVPVDLRLANSSWTADMIEMEIDQRPTVILSGIDRGIFRPYGTAPRYPLLCSGDDDRSWKGTATIREAAHRLGLPLETYAGKDLGQVALGREYASAEVFAVGSWFEGFGQPGLEALACGVPLVTTDNGGCREYAHDGETALVVPPRDATAMADAIGRLHAEPTLASELSRNGLEVVRRDFDWEHRTDELEEVLTGLATTAAPTPTASPPSPEAPQPPTLSVVVLGWNNLMHTQACVESVRQHTDVPYELIIVDNGSHADAADYSRQAADVFVSNPQNLGFAKGMNQGLAAASGTFVAFCNNDIEVPPAWASLLLETAGRNEDSGIVVPALTAAGNPATVRSAPGDRTVPCPRSPHPRRPSCT